MTAPTAEPRAPVTEARASVETSLEIAVEAPAHRSEARALVEIEAPASMECESSGSAICPATLSKVEEELGKGRRAKHLKALSDAAAILREVGDTTEAQALERRAQMMMKTDTSVSDATRMFLMARSMERAEHERREQEATQREDKRKRELDAMFRLAKEETAAKKAMAGGAAAEARKRKLDIEAQRREAKAIKEREKIILRICSSIWLQISWRKQGLSWRMQSWARAARRSSELWPRHAVVGSIGWLPVEQCLTLLGMVVCALATSLSLRPSAW